MFVVLHLKWIHLLLVHFLCLSWVRISLDKLLSLNCLFTLMVLSDMPKVFFMLKMFLITLICKHLVLVSNSFSHSSFEHCFSYSSLFAESFLTCCLWMPVIEGRGKEWQALRILGYQCQMLSFILKIVKTVKYSTIKSCACNWHSPYNSVLNIINQ